MRRPLETGDVLKGRINLVRLRLSSNKLGYGINVYPNVPIKTRMEHTHHYVPDRFPPLQGNHRRMCVTREIRTIFMYGFPTRVNGCSSHHLVERQSQNSFSSGVCRNDLPFSVLIHYPLCHSFKQRPMPGLALSQRLLHPLSLGDVRDENLHRPLALVT